MFDTGDHHDIRYELYDPLVAADGRDWVTEVLAPWAAGHPAFLAALRQAGEPRSASVLVGQEGSWALYALSRVAETLILPHQPPGTGSGDWVPSTAYAAFTAAIGGGFPRVAGFHPFFHEIVEVEAAGEPDAAPTLVKQCWPGCMIGSMMLLRSGVTVRAGRNVLDPAVTTGSVLFWAYRRRYREVEDLSHGWGSNSQWRTSFRRDYLLPGELRYNVDAALDPREEYPGGLPFSRDVGLLRYRCRTFGEDGEDEWIWENHAVEPFRLQELQADEDVREGEGGGEYGR